MFEVHITVNLKKGITDPEGANTLKALHLLGFSNVKHTQKNHTFILHMDGTDTTSIKKEAEQMCKRLLTNPVIHHYEITINQIKE